MRRTIGSFGGLLFLLAIAHAVVAQTTTPARQTPSTAPAPMATWDSIDPEPFDSVHSDDCKIWVAKYIDHTVHEGTVSPPNYEVGTVRLSIEQVLKGDPSVKTAVVPYSRFHQTGRGGIHTPLPTKWKDLPTLRAGALMLVIIQPRANEIAKAYYPGNTDFAGRVYWLTSEDDPIVKTYARLCSLDALKGDQFYDAVTDAAGDDDPLLRKYAIESGNAAAKLLAQDKAVALLLHAVEETQRLKAPPDQLNFACFHLQLRIRSRDGTPDEFLAAVDEYARLGAGADAAQRDFFVLGIYEMTLDPAFGRWGGYVADISQPTHDLLRQEAIASESSTDIRVPLFAKDVVELLDAPTTRATTAPADAPAP